MTEKGAVQDYIWASEKKGKGGLLERGCADEGRNKRWRWERRGRKEGR